MTFLKTLSAVMFVALLSYTLVTGATYGWNLFEIFFTDMLAMTWPGQFNFDFTGFLILSGLWVLWRHEFSVVGWVLAPVAFVGGILFLSAYLFYLTSRRVTTMPELLLGEARTAALMKGAAAAH
ncbi:hypothetical protein [Sulfitobacter aestuariivivens]|uniref:Uncharacterized protein n=1 Tax=Sulfitobacter aestuariivivens TaxID=2766981 RepID=A0A927D640_9RHOB|nr:hypothetical protein [Sulfitobacter aestuariivivens]MBD3664157.1 hypothetical protein [Sulfitobacter aestuariivivens]